MPHIGLGRVRSTAIKQHLKDPTQFETIFERIQLAIKKVVLEIITDTYALIDQKLAFEKVGVLDLKKRAVVKEYQL